MKGIWIRPTYFNKKDIETVLDNLVQTGIDNVFIETYYHGKTIFPSKTMEKYGFIKQYEDFVGFDPLKVWISEAHKRGIKVHIWFQTFYVGNKPPETNPNYILAKRPEWANYQKKNVNSKTIPYSISEHNGYFIYPANPEVQAFLYELLCEIVYRYKPDGINLDYIRYPQSLASSYSNYDMSNWGYTNYARNEFRDTYGADPIYLKTYDPLWNYWNYYRCSKITDFVRKVSGLCRANEITYTAVIFPNRKNAIDTKLQDWKTWSINNFVDGFTPLLLTCDDKTATNLIEEVLRNNFFNARVVAEKQMIDVINAFRNFNGLSLLREDIVATASCRKHAQDMADNNYFSHNNLQNQTPWDRYESIGGKFYACAENITYDASTCQDTFDNLLNNPEQRSNMLHSMATYIGSGMGYNPNSDYMFYTSLLFAYAK